jgi:hypothetical protein
MSTEEGRLLNRGELVGLVTEILSIVDRIPVEWQRATVLSLALSLRDSPSSAGDDVSSTGQYSASAPGATTGRG